MVSPTPTTLDSSGISQDEGRAGRRVEARRSYDVRSDNDDREALEEPRATWREFRIREVVDGERRIDCLGGSRSDRSRDLREGCGLTQARAMSSRSRKLWLSPRGKSNDRRNACRIILRQTQPTAHMVSSSIRRSPPVVCVFHRRAPRHPSLIFHYAVRQLSWQVRITHHGLSTGHVAESGSRRGFNLACGFGCRDNLEWLYFANNVHASWKPQMRSLKDRQAGRH